MFQEQEKVNKVILFSSLFLLILFATIPSSFAWHGQMAMDSDGRNVEYGDIIKYEGYLYGEHLIENELVHITVTEQKSDKTIWNASFSPSTKTVEYFDNTAWTFNFIIDTSKSDYQTDTIYIVEAAYDDKFTQLDFMISPKGQLKEKAIEAGNAIIIAGEKTGQTVVEAGSQAKEVVVEKGSEAGKVIVEKGKETGEAIVEKGEVVGKVVAEKATETGQVIAEKSSEGIQEINEEGGGCLIATAAYGTELAPQVQFLREIRDNTVMSTASGTSFMTGFNQLYYSFSPTIADIERENPVFQEMVRAFITPMISTLSIMTLAEDGSEIEVLGLGISVIALNLGMYVAAPAFVGFAISKKLKSNKK